jgi:hypothetical protein
LRQLKLASRSRIALAMNNIAPYLVLALFFGALLFAWFVLG